MVPKIHVLIPKAVNMSPCVAKGFCSCNEGYYLDDLKTGQLYLKVKRKKNGDEIIKEIIL